MKRENGARGNKLLMQIASFVVTLSMVFSLVPTQAVAEMQEELAELGEASMVIQEDQESPADDQSQETSQEESEETDSTAENEQVEEELASTTEPAQSEAEDSGDEEVAPAEEERNTQQSLVFEDDAVKVTVTLDDPAALPKDVRLVVTPVTEDTTEYPYNAYLNALNDHAGDAQTYNNQNTLLYDVAFFAPNEEGTDVEVQPQEGAVRVSFEFKQHQLKDELDAKKAADLNVIHLPMEDGEPVVEPLDANVSVANETASFSTTSFSVYAFSYTVDFTYDGFTYSIAGQSDILLSKLFQILSIDENAARATNVTFSNNELAKVERSGDDWLLTSLKPFTSEELLTVTMASGAEYRIVVTDAQGEAVSVTLNSYDNTGTIAEAFAPTDEGGHYWVYAQITNKETGDVVGWSAKQVDAFKGQQTYSVSLDEFVSVADGSALAYNASEHNVAVRFMWNKTDAEVTYDYVTAQQKTNGDARALFDIIGGYTFQGSYDPNPTVSDANPATISLRHDLSENEYALHLKFTDTSGEVSKSSSSTYYVIGKIRHQSGDVYFYAPMTEPSAGASQYFVINGTQGGQPYTWLDQNGGYKNERFTGKEAATQLYVVEWTGSGDMQFNGQVIQRLNGQGGAKELNVLSSTDAVGDYSYSFATERGKRTDGDKTQYYDTVELSKVSGGLSRDEVLATLEHALGFGLYTGNLEGHVSDMEANIAAGTVAAGAIGADYGFSNNNKQVNKLTVTKTYVDDAGKPLANEPVEILLYQQSGNEWVRVGNSITGTTDASGKLVVTFDKLDAGVYQVREKVNGTELSINNTTVGEGANKVVATFGGNITFEGSALNINYFADINDNASTSDLVKLLSKSRNGIVIAGNEADYNRLLAVRNTMSGFTGSVYLAGSDIPGVGTYAPLDVSGDLEAYRALSVALAQSGDTETINVYNYTYNNLPNDMYRLNSDGKLVVVNIDMTGVTGSPNVLTRTNLDGENLEAHFNKDGSSAKRRIIYNLYVRNADGSIAPYTGAVNTNGTTSGTLLAPSAQLGSLAGDWGGTMISASTYHSGGEIHSEYDNAERTQETGIANTKGGEQEEAKGSLTVKKNVTVNGKATTGTDADGTYTFTVAGPNGYTNTVSITISNGKSSQTTLSDLTPGEYTITEQPPTNGTSLVGDNNITCNVVANNTANIPTVEFTNNKNDEYHTSGEITLSGTKELQGRALREGEFTFELYEGDSATPLRTATNKADGSYAFAPIEYTESDLGKDENGNYVETEKTYRVVERAGDDATVSYDDTEYSVTVTLTDDGAGHITATADRGVNDLDFTNTYETSGDITLSGTKELQGRALREGEFTFELYEGDSATPLQTATNEEDGSYAFAPIAYAGADLDTDENGSYVETTKAYRVVERAGTDTTVGYDDRTYDVTVTLADDGAGHITATATPESGTYAFTNEYRTSGDITLSGKKTLEGAKLEEGEFTFELYEGDSTTPLQTATNEADGSYAFAPIAYTESDLGKDENGNYVETEKTYRVVERAGTDTTVGYDDRTYDVTVTLTDDGAGHITATATPESGTYAFTNTYEAKGEITFSGVKTMEGMALNAGDFTFQLKDEEGNLLQEAKNEADGTYAFKTISYTLDDLDTDGEGNHIPTTKTYSVSEVKGGNEHVKYDETVYTIKVTLEDKGNNVIEVASDKVPGACNFTNTYETSGDITLSGTKELQGRALREGEFTFELYEGDSTTPLQTATNEEDGSYAFAPIEYTESDLGKDENGNYVETEKTYRVVEKAGDDESIDYDGRTYHVTVTLTDDGEGHITAEADPDADAFDFVNKKLGSLQITKTVDGVPVSEQAGKAFVVSILYIGGDEDLMGHFLTSDGTFVEEYDEQHPMPEVPAGGELVIRNIPTGEYQVTEVLDEDPSAEDRAYVQLFGDDYLFLEVSGEGAAEVPADGMATIDLVNVYFTSGKGSLRVVKVVNSTLALTDEEKKAISFVVKDADGNVIGQKSLYDFTEAYAGSQAWVITDLEPGRYTVAEIRRDPADPDSVEHIGAVSYEVEAGSGEFNYGLTEGVVVVRPDEASTVTVQNTFNEVMAFAKLKVQKLVEGSTQSDSYDANEEFVFDVTKVNDPKVDGVPSCVLPTDPTITVKAGDTGESNNIYFTQDGTYYFAITERVPEKKTPGMTYNTKPSYARVVVDQDGNTSITYGTRLVDNGDGTYEFSPVQESDHATVTNTYEVGGLTVTKTVAGDLTAGELTQEEKEAIVFTVTGPNDYYTSFTLADMGSELQKTLLGLPVGTYTVREQTAAREGWTIATAYSVENGVVAVAKGEDVPAQVDVTNTYTEGKTIDLEVRKSVQSSDDADKNKEFSFQVTLDQAISGTYGDMEFVDGVAAFALKDGESVVATGLPEGISYQAEELDSGDLLSSASEEKTDAGAVVTFTNTRGGTTKTGDLEVKKVVRSSQASDKQTTFGFKVTLSNTGVNGTYGNMTFEDSVATFTLRDGESKKATGLPTGITYHVVETSKGGLLSSLTASADGSTVTCTNTRSTTPSRSTTGSTSSGSSSTGTSVGSRTSTPKTADTTSVATVMGLTVLGALGIFASGLRRRNQ